VNGTGEATLPGRTLAPSAVARPSRPLGFLDRRLREKVLENLAAWRDGHLTLLLPDGRRLEAGPHDAGPRATLSIHDERFFRKVALGGRMGLGDAYVDGDWSADDLPAVLELGVRNRSAAHRPWLARVRSRFGERRPDNDRPGSRRNVKAHYDLGNEFFALWLDPSMTYSAAMFAAPGEDLGTAQLRKLETLARKAGIREGDRVLEIGCGWGSFAIHVARTRGCPVTALTLSPAQHRLATERVRAAGVAHLVEVRLEDWRDTEGSWDRIVSIEMFEAVGRRWWSPWFQALDRLLAPGGVVAIQAICHPDRGFEAYARHRDWIEKRIFPGSLLGCLRVFTDVLARDTTLRIHHLEDVGPDYAETLLRWRERFLARVEDVKALGFDDRFVRTWEYYLAVCEGAFRARHLSDLQIVLAREGDARLPAPARRPLA